MKDVDFKIEGNEIFFSAYFARKSTVAKLGTSKSLIQSAITGVTHGYSYKMKIAYSHFPITVEVPKNSDEILIKNFLGERNPRYTVKAAKNIDIKANKEDVVVSGIDKEAVGQTAANIQKRCRIRQKDHRRFQDGIWLYEKYAGEELIWKLKI
ncbi:MAG: 50S ribosomal protein L6 [archaeon]|nr:50S ribosomal protein L6 [archaeon]